jgi:hypothetical protein
VWRPLVQESTLPACIWKVTFQVEPSTCVTTSPLTATVSVD